MKSTIYSGVWTLLLSLGLNLSAHAGTGQIVDGKVDLSVRFNYREADPDSWRPLFEEASRLLYNATNGQLQLGRIRVSDCGLGRSEADVWIQTGASGAFANVFGLGGAGHIYLSQVHKSTNGLALGQFGLVHEFGHYGFGLFDEYKGAPPQFAGRIAEQVAKSALHQFCTSEDDSVTCIMDGGTMIVPNHARTEFCTAAGAGLSSAHNSGLTFDGIHYENAQQTLNGESCWETIEREVGLTPPLSVDPSDPPGLEPITWEVTPDQERLVLCIDRSASMLQRPSSLDRAKSLADLLVGFLHGRKTVTIDGAEITLEGERLAVVTFADQAAVAAPFREMITEASKDSARDAIDGIAGNGTGNYLATDVAAGLRTSLDLLAASGPVPSCSEAIILLSDGAANLGGSLLDLLPELQDRGTRLYSVELAKGTSLDSLRVLADSSRGRSFPAGPGVGENELAQSIAAEVRSAGVLAQLSDSTSGQDEHQAILIDSFAEEVTCALQWDQGELDLTLTSPSGDVIDFASAEQREDVEAARGDGIVYLRVVHPEHGSWDAWIHPVQVPGTIRYQLTATDENRSVTVTGAATRAGLALRLRVEVVAGVPVAGAEVSAIVDRPGGSPATVQLFDDGLPAHGDQWAGDGVYQTLFHDFTQDGPYRFHATVTCLNGHGPNPDLPFVEDGPGPPLTVPPFVREVEFSTDVDFVSEVIHGLLRAAPRSLNVGNPHGKLTCYLELPAPHLPGEVDLASIRLNGVPRAPSTPATIGDFDADGIPDLMVKFDRAAIIGTLPDGALGPLWMTGQLLGGSLWQAEDQITILHPGSGTVVLTPAIAEAGGTVLLSWPASSGSPISYSGYLSGDEGQSWSRIFTGVTEASYSWQVPDSIGSGYRLLVQADSPEGVVGQTLSASFEITTLSSVPAGTSFTTMFLGAGPNPWTQSTTLRFSLQEAMEARLEIYDVHGRLVRVLASGALEAGRHSVDWDGTDAQGAPVAAGAYLYRFSAGTARASGRLMLVH